MKKQPDTHLFSAGRVAAFASAAPGLAPLAAVELAERGLQVGAVSDAGVEFTATADELLIANLWSRTASRILVRIASFTARDFATLERHALQVDWQRVIRRNAPVRLRVTCRKSRLYHSDAVGERVSRAIAQRVSGALVALRSTDEEDSEGESQLIVVRFEHDVCTISADSSGDLLHRRGWRQAIAKAPLRETLAAAMIQSCHWQGERALVDPFCGSGTIGIEAALKARNMAPGLGRSFAMEAWPGVSHDMLRALRDQAKTEARDGVEVPIVMSDRDAGACEAAASNAERAGVLEDLDILQQPLSEVDLGEIANEGLVLTNPPYGQRLGDGTDMRALYARLGDVVRAGGRDWQLAMLVPDKKLSGQVGMVMSPLLRTSNGGIGVALESTSPRKVRRGAR